MKTVLFCALLVVLVSFAEAAEWPLARLGNSGLNVNSLQNLLTYRGYSIASDGLFGYSTEEKVESFQSANGLTADGLVGENTWSALCPLIGKGDQNDAVKAFQHQLVKHGYTIAIDGVFSSEMDTMVRDLQAAYGLDVDGLVGANTWREGLGNKNTFVQPASEFRGAWVATVSHIDWPSKTGLTPAQQQQELIVILDTLVELKMNAIVFQVRPEGDAFYESTIGEPWSRFLTGKQGTPPSPYYDPLAFAINEAHKRGLELHAWYNPYRAAVDNSIPLHPTHMGVELAEYAYKFGQYLWMDPGSEAVQNRTYNSILDVVRRYDVDGIHFDDYFYPYPIEGVEFPDSKTYQAYRDGGGSLSLDDWRRDNVNKLVERLNVGIHEVKPYMKFGISPFGIYRPGIPPTIVGFDQFGDLFADPKLWLEQGWVDYLAPQLYWRVDPPQQSYLTLNDWWVSINTKNRHVYPGNYLSQLDGTNWPANEFQRQVDITRNMDRGSLGNIFFSMKIFLQDKLGIKDYFKNNIYTQSATIPTMDWLPKKNMTSY